MCVGAGHGFGVTPVALVRSSRDVGPDGGSARVTARPCRSGSICGGVAECHEASTARVRRGGIGVPGVSTARACRLASGCSSPARSGGRRHQRSHGRFAFGRRVDRDIDASFVGAAPSCSRRGIAAAVRSVPGRRCLPCGGFTGAAVCGTEGDLLPHSVMRVLSSEPGRRLRRLFGDHRWQRRRLRLPEGASGQISDRSRLFRW